MDPKVKFLNVFKPSDFEWGKELYPFSNIISMMDICQSGRKKVLTSEVYNPMIDRLTNQHHKKFLKDLHAKITKSVKFSSSKFALRNKSFTLLDLVAKYSTSFLTGALKKGPENFSRKKNPPPLMDIQKKRRPHYSYS